jgi:hypothetical protein
MSSPKHKVAILLPSLGGFTEETMIATTSLAMYSFTRGIHTDLMNESVTGVAKCRNALVEAAIKGDYTHILFIDSDMYFPMTMLESLLKHDKDIVGVPYVGRAHPVFLLGHPMKDEDKLATSGLIEAKTMPSGLMLIRTDVFRKVPQPWYFESYGYTGAPMQQFMQCIQDALADTIPADVAAEMVMSPKLTAWLAGYHGENGLTKEISEDINFVFKARRFGFQTWSDLDIAPHVYHVGKYAYSIRDLMERVNNGGQMDSRGHVQA